MFKKYSFGSSCGSMKQNFGRKKFGSCGACNLKSGFGRKSIKRKSIKRKSFGKRKSFKRSKTSFGKHMKKCLDCGHNYRKKRSHMKNCKKHRKFSFGPGYKAQTTYQNHSVPYFGSKEPWVNASGWWYPNVGGKVQSPQMIIKN